MVFALLSESNLDLSDDVVESIVEKVSDNVNCLICCISIILLSGYLYLVMFVQTMMEADMKGDGKIDEEEWREFVKKNPSIIRNMTLPYLKWVLKIFHLIFLLLSYFII